LYVLADFIEAFYARIAVRAVTQADELANAVANRDAVLEFIA